MIELTPSVPKKWANLVKNWFAEQFNWVGLGARAALSKRLYTLDMYYILCNFVLLFFKRKSFEESSL